MDFFLLFNLVQTDDYLHIFEYI